MPSAVRPCNWPFGWILVICAISGSTRAGPTRIMRGDIGRVLAPGGDKFSYMRWLPRLAYSARGLLVDLRWLATSRLTRGHRRYRPGAIGRLGFRACTNNGLWHPWRGGLWPATVVRRDVPHARHARIAKRSGRGGRRLHSHNDWVLVDSTPRAGVLDSRFFTKFLRAMKLSGERCGLLFHARWRGVLESHASRRRHDIGRKVWSYKV